jgi:hypothetical protein
MFKQIIKNDKFNYLINIITYILSQDVVEGFFTMIYIHTNIYLSHAHIYILLTLEDVSVSKILIIIL